MVSRDDGDVESRRIYSGQRAVDVADDGLDGLAHTLRGASACGSHSCPLLTDLERAGGSVRFQSTATTIAPREKVLKSYPIKGLKAEEPIPWKGIGLSTVSKTVGLGEESASSILELTRLNQVLEDPCATMEGNSSF